MCFNIVIDLTVLYYCNVVHRDALYKWIVFQSCLIHAYILNPGFPHSFAIMHAMCTCEKEPTGKSVKQDI